MATSTQAPPTLHFRMGSPAILPLLAAAHGLATDALPPLLPTAPPKVVIFPDRLAAWVAHMAERDAQDGGER